MPADITPIRWTVRGLPPAWEAEVTAYRMDVGPGGSLVFTDADDNTVRAYAPGTWASATEAQD